MQDNNKKSFLEKPSWALALLTSVAAILVVLFYTLIYGFLTFARHDNDIIGSTIVPLTLYLGIIIIFSFFIVKRNPKSVWYVPVITNLVGILLATLKSGFWNNQTFWIPVCGGWILTIIVSIIGSLIGKRETISGNP